MSKSSQKRWPLKRLLSKLQICNRSGNSSKSELTAPSSATGSSDQAEGTGPTIDILPELLDIIFDAVAPRRSTVLDESVSGSLIAFVHLDKSDIAAASLVCRKWRTAALRHLFRDMVFYCEPTSYETPAGASSVHDVKGGLCLLLQFLRCFPATCRWITHLSIVAPWRELAHEANHYTLDARQLSSVLHQLTKLHTLVLLRGTVNSSLKLPYLKDVHIVLPHAAPDGVFTTLNAFSTVQDLHLHLAHSISQPSDTVIDVRAVDTLFLHGLFTMNKTAKLLSRWLFVVSLKGLVIADIHLFTDIDADMYSALKTCSASLQYLELHFSLIDRDLKPTLLQMPWPRLHTFVFSIPLSFEKSERSNWRSLSEFAATLTSCPVLRTIKMTIKVVSPLPSNMESCTDDVSALKNIFDSLPALERFIVNAQSMIVGHVHPIGAGMRQCFIDLWPALHEKGVLSFDT